MDAVPSRRRAAAVSLLLAAAVLLVFLPVRNHGFINYDDGPYVYENREVLAGLTAHGVAWAFTGRNETGNWHPMAWISHMTDVQLFGVDPGAHHLVGLALHVAATLALFWLLRLATGVLWPSAVVAALFGVHPLHVESVAWIAERKDVLCALFWFLAAGLHVRYCRRPGGWRLAAVALAAAGALLAKPMAVTLPLTLLLLDFWPLGRLLRRPGPGAPAGGAAALPALVLEKLPLFALAAAVGVATLLAQRAGMTPVAALTLGHRAANAVVAGGAYLWRALWPADLAIFYPLTLEPPPAWQVAASALALAAGSAAAIALRRRAPAALAGWLWYLLTLAPVAGIVQVGAQAMADRYTYVPLVGPFFALAWGLPALARRPAASRALGGLAAAALVALALAAHRQVLTWRDSETVFTQALRATRDNWLAHNNLADFYAKAGRRAEANEHLARALVLDPTYRYRRGGAAAPAPAPAPAPTAAGRLNDEGLARVRAGDLAGGVELFRRAVAEAPGDVGARINLANALNDLGRTDEAAAQFREAAARDPKNPTPLFGLGIVQAGRGELDAAAASYAAAIALRPAFAEAYNNLGAVEAQRGRAAEAERAFATAVGIQPGYAQARVNLGLLLEARGRREDALVQFREALRTDPANATAREHLGR
jgi:Flp pilus assembly protein TadD